MKSNNFNNCYIYPCGIARLGCYDCNNIWDCSRCEVSNKQKIKDLIWRFAYEMIEMEARGERLP